MLHPEVRRSGRRSDRGPSIVWSGLAGAAIAALVVGGGLFWASVWGALAAPTDTGVGAAAVTDAAPPLEDAGAVRLASIEGSPEEGSPEGPDMPEGQAAAGTLEVPDVPEVQTAASVAAEERIEVETTADRVEGSAEIADAGEDPGSPGTLAPGDADDEDPDQEDAAGEQVADEGEQAPDKVEELTARLEDLTVRMEALAARLEVPGATPTAQPSGVPVPDAGLPRPDAAARAGQESAPTRPPWVLLPRPDPGSRVAAGPLVLEARARGEAPITQIRLLLDGVALPVALERRDDRTWRGQATTRVGPGSHAVVVRVVDAAGRTGSYRWRFDATAP